MGFPRDDYTPHGYLDIPTHTRNLTPRGVVRSHGAGFRWHFPAYAGMYGGRRETYRAGFRLAVDGALELAEFNAAGSPYHSKDIFAVDLARGQARVHAEWFLVGEHALCATVESHGLARLSLHVAYTRLLSANGEWGESGLVGRWLGDCLVLQGFEDGEAFVFWTSTPPSDVGLTGAEGEARGWAERPAPGLPDGGFVTTLGTRGDTVSLHAVLGFASHDARLLTAILARGATLAEAQHRMAEARRTAPVERARKAAADEAFWATAPRLDGDWPDHWRRGLVYDLETVRMMAKPPVGRYAHVWDAMQIQAPRVVLAEAAIDALLIAYADPCLAQEVLLGTFLDAAAPNVPCSREDGSFNMVAADGTVCGTAPPWGYPWVVAEWLAMLRPDRSWLERLYPRLAAYLDWWLAHRRDGDGWLVYACSWESGQDGTPRLGEQPLGGGHPTRHVRPVDLQAAFAHAAQVMARFAGMLEREHDRAKWRGLADEYAGRTDQLWNGTRYADFDVAAGRFTEVDDVMLLAPLALGVAPAERADRLRDRIATMTSDELVWPMFVWTAVAAASAAGVPMMAAELAGAVCDRAYRLWDARDAASDRTLPGIACEYWPPHGRCGGEGYGWGAFTTHLLLHYLIGFAPVADGFRLRPNLPPDLRLPGRSYGVRIAVGDTPLTISLQPAAHDRVRVAVGGRALEIGWAETLIYGRDGLEVTRS